jgi:hypothetical protein
MNIEKLTENELKGLNYFYFNDLVAIIGSVFAKAGIPKVNPIPQEYFESVKTGICNEWFGGCEPEWETESDYDEWESIGPDKYRYMTTDEFEHLRSIGDYTFNSQHSPYQNKDIPWLVRIKICNQC